MATTPKTPKTLSSAGTTAAVIVTHQRVELLRASLEIVANQDHPVEWIIVVDNGAEVDVEKLVTEVAGERGVYLPSRTNLGGAGGFAYGFLHALALGADAIWCADDDGRPGSTDTLSTLYSVAEARSLHQVSPTVCNIDDPEKLAFPLRQGVTWHRRVDDLEGDFIESYASLFNGALISADATAIIGVPDYRLFIRGDEVEYHRRLARAAAQSTLRYGTSLRAFYLHPDGADEFKPILGGKMHAQYPDSTFKRYFTYRNRGYLIAQPGNRKLAIQEIGRFGWFFLIERKDPAGFFSWLKLLRRGSREDFRRP